MSKRKFHKPKRVFVGIKLPEELTDAFLDMQSSLGSIPGKFIPPEDIHLTLVPPFETADLPFIEGTLKTALQNTSKFKLRFLRLEPGPDKKRPRLAWVQCAASEELISLKKRLLKVLGLKEKIPFVPHMTIVRFGKTNPKEAARYKIKRPVKFSVKVESVELFESPHLGGVGYKVLKSIELHPGNGILT